MRTSPSSADWTRRRDRHGLAPGFAATDPKRSVPYRPWHPHDRAEPLTPGETVPLDVEIWPTSVVVPAGYRLALTVQGRDFEFPGDGPWPSVYGVKLRGHGMFVHTDPASRPADVYGGTTTLVSGPARSRICCCPSSRARPGVGPRSGADRSPAPEELQQAIADMRTGRLGKIPALTT